MFLDDVNFIGKIENSSRLMQGLFGSHPLSRNDLVLLESLLFDMIEGKISAENIID